MFYILTGVTTIQTRIVVKQIEERKSLQDYKDCASRGRSYKTFVFATVDFFVFNIWILRTDYDVTLMGILP